MSIPAKSIIRRVVDTLQDTTSVRWPIPELVRYLNDGQREIALHRPDSLTARTNINLIAGSTQSLPANGAKLIDIVANNGGGAVRLVNREILDAQQPGWHQMPGKKHILHFMYDPREPRTFLVYPPSDGTTSLQIVYAIYPQDIAEPAEGSTHNQVLGNISLPDIYANALQDYILYRAYTKDSEYAGNAARAQAHYAALANTLGLEIRATIAVAPTSPGNPNAIKTNTAALGA